MTTFDLPTCKRLAKILGHKCPKTGLYFHDHGEGVGVEACNGWGHEKEVIAPAFRLDNLTAEVWQEIGKKLGWRNAYRMEKWKYYAGTTYQAFLVGGYPEASKYLCSIIPE